MGALSPTPDHIAVFAQARIDNAVIRLMAEGTLHAEHLMCGFIVGRKSGKNRGQSCQSWVDAGDQHNGLLTGVKAVLDRPEISYTAPRLRWQWFGAPLRQRRD